MQEKIFLGTYTKKKSQGIYTVELDTDKKELTNLTLFTEESGPTFVALSEKGNLYNVTSVDGNGGVASYSKDGKLLNTVTSPGASPCYVAVDENRQLVFSANYHKGQVAVYKIEADGSLTLTDEVTHTDPTGSHENQDKPHAHYADLTPDHRLVACDLGTDTVYTYDLSANGKLSLASKLKVADKTGPRHLTFHPTLDIAYLFGELNSTISVLAYNRADGHFEVLATYPTLPANYEGFNSGSAVKVTKDGKFLYGSNRGDNSIVVFAIAEDGRSLTFIERVDTYGDFPRDFSLNPSEEFLVCAHQNSDNLTLYQRDAQTGKLTLLQKDVFAPEAVCVKFV